MPARRTALRRLGQLLVALGVGVLVVVGYQLQGTDLYAARAQSILRHSLEGEWARPQPSPASTSARVTLGDGVAILRVPRFGRGYVEVIVEGVGRTDLRHGPGHYPGTAMPGRVGNFAVAGHRTPFGAPFARLGELRPGDAVVLETAHSWLTYRVTGSRIVAPTAVSVIAPVPGAPNRAPTAVTLTLTTCNPRYSDRQRLVVFGVLAEKLARSAGVPAALRA
ncbi:MAG: class E sortase [Mycobacteriales bacterium]